MTFPDKIPLFQRIPSIVYERQKSSCLKPEEIAPDINYFMHLKLREPFRDTGIVTYAVSSLVRVSYVDEGRRGWFVVMNLLDYRTEEPIDPVYTPGITTEGILMGTTNSHLPSSEGYFAGVHSETDGDYLEADERLSRPVMAGLGSLALAAH